ncbi:MAG: OadG family protein [Treponema sp.]|jgi:oxaloacetate decarboxylase gamma subunit|nr:OadG family protein [Treponema sp.]
MTIEEMFQQSAVLTVLGMGTVFVFLWIMIICINWVGKLVHTLGLDKEPPQKNTNKKNDSTPSEITAAITTAITEYRKNGKADE